MPVIMFKEAVARDLVKKYLGHLSGSNVARERARFISGQAFEDIQKLRDGAAHAGRTIDDYVSASAKYPWTDLLNAKKTRDIARGATAAGVAGLGLGGYAIHRNQKNKAQENKEQ